MILTDLNKRFEKIAFAVNNARAARSAVEIPRPSSEELRGEQEV